MVKYKESAKRNLFYGITNGVIGAFALSTATLDTTYISFELASGGVLTTHPYQLLEPVALLPFWLFLGAHTGLSSIET